MSAPCPLGICDGTGFLVDEQTNEAVPCECRPARINRARARSLSAVIPKRYRGVSFDRAPVVDMDPKIVREVRRYVDEVDARLDAGRSVAIYSLPRLLNEIRKTFGERAEASHLDLLERLSRIDLLHLDDVGAERTSEWVLEELYSIVNARYEDERAMIITTNLPHDKLIEQIGERTVSRLIEICGDPLPLYGHDRRMDLRAS